MNILVDSCSYNCQNVGDLAMLTVAVTTAARTLAGSVHARHHQRA